MMIAELYLPTMPWIDFNLPAKGRIGKRQRAEAVNAVQRRDREALASLGAPGPVRLNVVGSSHDNADGSSRQVEIAALRPGEPVSLRREPTNKHDPSAVAVFSARGVQIGYLGEQRAAWIGSKIDKGQLRGAVVDRIIGRPGEMKAVIKIEIAAS